MRWPMLALAVGVIAIILGLDEKRGDEYQKDPCKKCDLLDSAYCLDCREKIRANTRDTTDNQSKTA